MSAIRRGNNEVDDETVNLGDDAENNAAFDVYADLKANLTEQVEDHIIDLPVPNRQRSGTTYIRYNCTFEYDTLNRWMKSSQTGRGQNKRTDPKKLSHLVLHACCVGIGVEKNGVKREMLIGGNPVTFDSKEIQDMLGTMSGWSGAITTMYSNDGHMMQTMNRIITEAGYNEIDLDDVDGYDPLA